MFFKKIFFIFLIFSLISGKSFGQPAQNFFTPSPVLDNNRLIPVLIGEGSGYAVSMIGLNYLWYKHYPRSAFHFFDDNKEWQQMDKCGHFLTAYTISRLASVGYKWCGVNGSPANIYGASLGLGYQTNIEIFDGFSSAWGFSPGDMIANTAGTSLFLVEQYGWGDQRVLLKISFHPSGLSDYRPDELGSNFIEECIKDYNGQTYWVSIAIASFFPKSYKIPGWLAFDFGYGAGGMIGAVTNPPVYDDNGNELDFDRYRKYFCSLDINLTDIPTRSAPLKTLFGAVSFIKIPAPTLEFSKKKLHFHILYF